MPNNKAKKLVVLALVSSQMLTSLPLTAVASTSSNIEQENQKAKDKEEQLLADNRQEQGDLERETIISEEEVEEVEADSILDEDQLTPDEQPEPEGKETESTPESKEKPTPIPEPETAPVVKPDSEPQPSQPDEADDQDQGVQIAPEINEVPSAPEMIQKDDVKGSSNDFVVTPVKETWDFIKEIGEDAREIGLEEDLYASVMIAQAILESDSGQSKLSQDPYFNLFGIKGTYQGNGVSFKTQEDDGKGNLHTITATFRKYDNIESSLNDYAKLMKEGLDQDTDFYKGTWKSETQTYKDATEFLTGRYATDTLYGEKLNALIEAYALTSYDKEKISLPEGNEEMIYPVMNPVISSSFGPRGDSFHRGVDFAAPKGTPIMASLSGVVILSEYHPSWGNYIVIEHENGLTTLYAHNNQNLVTVGQMVSQRDVIASMGSTGNSTGPHLHFEVSRSSSLAQNQLINPMTVLKNR